MSTQKRAGRWNALRPAARGACPEEEGLGERFRLPGPRVEWSIGERFRLISPRAEGNASGNVGCDRFRKK